MQSLRLRNVFALMRAAAGLELTHVPYRGKAPAIPDPIAGRIDLMFLKTAKPLVDSGQVIGLGITWNEPRFHLPGIKPLNDVGLRDMEHFTRVVRERKLRFDT
jgi:tripartite-type tricarboxylate transporter receptor subunit TctC